MAAEIITADHVMNMIIGGYGRRVCWFGSANIVPTDSVIDRYENEREWEPQIPQR